MTTTVIVCILILHESVRFLLDCIVCQVHKQIVKIAFLGSFVFLSGESSKTLLEYKNSQWLNSINKCVDSKIEFESINQIRFCHVTLCYKLFAWRDLNIFIAASEVDASTLAHVHWFYNESFGFLLTELTFEVVRVGWQAPGLWEKVVFVFVGFCHAH